MGAYYNENDPKAAAWLRELIKAGVIAPGDVDERSIEDVTPNDLRGYRQCHFFAGIGGWSYALRLAGWSDDRPVWTGSCPCQPFSAAGKGKGFADERHLWPAWFHIIGQCRPTTLFGEQVASPAGLAWFDTVSTDLEGAGYAVGAADLCAAGVGAPHIRQRLYWMADANYGSKHALLRAEQNHTAQDLRSGTTLRLERQVARGYEGQLDWLAHTECYAVQPWRPASESRESIRASSPRTSVESGRCGLPSDLGDADNARSQGRGERRDGADIRAPWASSLVNCRDGKRRPVEPSTFPLAHGVPGRVGLLRGYGNAIVPQVAEAFIRSYLDVA